MVTRKRKPCDFKPAPTGFWVKKRPGCYEDLTGRFKFFASQVAPHYGILEDAEGDMVVVSGLNEAYAIAKGRVLADDFDMALRSQRKTALVGYR